MAAAPELVPELEPAAEVVVKEALPTLLLLCGLLVALGTVALAEYFVRIWFGTVTGALGWVPYLGKLVTAPLHSIQQKVTNLLGSWEAAVDHRLGMSLHKLARIGDKIGTALAAIGVAGFIVAYIIATHLNPAHWRAQVTHVITRVKTVVQRVSHIERVTHVITRTVTTVLARTVGPKLRMLTKAVTETIPGWIRRVESEATHAEKVAHGLEARVKHLEHDLTGAAFVALVATALATLGTTYTRCESNRDVGEALCEAGPQAGRGFARALRRLPRSGLAGLLSALLTAELLLNFEELVKLGQAVTHDTAEFVQTVLKVSGSTATTAPPTPTAPPGTSVPL